MRNGSKVLKQPVHAKVEERDNLSFAYEADRFAGGDGGVTKLRRELWDNREPTMATRNN